jgi:ADP-ribose pyrophosphatase YjhB (NUDIX family)
MELTIVLGDRALPKQSAVESALGVAGIDPRDVEVICLDIGGDTTEAAPLGNPDYAVRTRQHRHLWKQAIKRIRTSTAKYGIVICSSYGETDAGLEMSLPIDIFRAMTHSVCSTGGSVEIVCLIDDVFAIKQGSSMDLSRALTIRQLEWTSAQYIASQISGKYRPGVSCFALQHPATNLSSKILRKPTLSVYLCYPINFFRREPTHPLRAEVDRFRTDLADSGLVVYDPLGIDEEPIISQVLCARDSKSLKITSSARWPLPGLHPLLFTEPELDLDGSGIAVSPPPSNGVGRQSKAQIPQRDFFWIESADAVISWRPFLGNVHHAGVLAELQFALHKNKPIVAFSPREDGEERPSPFAAMVPTLPTLHELFGEIHQLAASVSRRRTLAMEASTPPKYCDHTSVGVLIYNDKGEVLLIERGTFPFGMAPVAGHVDLHSSYEEAAIAEVQEEVGLEITDLRLLAEGRRDNPCRRVNGSWHYWKIYEAKASGIVRLSPREARRAEWCDSKRLIELGLVPPDGAGDSRNYLEGVWIDWLSQLHRLHQ